MHHQRAHCRDFEVLDDVLFPVSTADLCSIHIDQFPAAISTVAAHFDGAKDLYRAFRQCQEDHLLLSPYWPRWFLIRVHAVSDTNTPMGFRDVVVPANLIGDLSWIPLAQTVWACNNARCSITLARFGERMPDAAHDHEIIIHVVADFYQRPGWLPILVFQSLVSIHDPGVSRDILAVCIPQVADRDTISDALDQPPFYHFEDTPLILRFAGHIIDDDPYFWKAGACLHLQVMVEDRKSVLDVLREAAEQPPSLEFDIETDLEEDTQSSLQIRTSFSPPTSLHASPGALGSDLVDTIIQEMRQCAWVQSDPSSMSPTVFPGDNRYLCQPHIPQFMHQSSSQLPDSLDTEEYVDLRRVCLAPDYAPAFVAQPPTAELVTWNDLPLDFCLDDVIPPVEAPMEPAMSRVVLLE